jgi:hypothetical protein
VKPNLHIFERIECRDTVLNLLAEMVIAQGVKAGHVVGDHESANALRSDTTGQTANMTNTRQSLRTHSEGTTNENYA